LKAEKALNLTVNLIDFKEDESLKNSSESFSPEKDQVENISNFVYIPHTKFPEETRVKIKNARLWNDVSFISQNPSNDRSTESRTHLVTIPTTRENTPYSYKKMSRQPKEISKIDSRFYERLLSKKSNQILDKSNISENSLRLPKIRNIKLSKVNSLNVYNNLQVIIFFKQSINII